MSGAIIIASGPIKPEAEELVRAALQPFVHQIREVQRIDLGGRTIVALLIEIDPAHRASIEAELNAQLEPESLDVAMEML